MLISDTSYAWSLIPIKKMMDDLSEHIAYINTVSNVLGVIANPKMDSSLKKALDKEYVDHLVKNAKKEVDSDHQKLARDFVIILYSLIEAGLNDFIKEVMLKAPELVKVNLIEKVKINGNLLIELDKEFAISELYREFCNCNKMPAGYKNFDNLLSIIGLNGTLHNHDQKNISELSQIRNVYVHRSGIVDDKLKDTCQWLTFRTGQKLKTTIEDVNRYVLSVLKYLGVITERLAAIVVPLEQDRIERTKRFKEKYEELKNDPGEQ